MMTIKHNYHTHTYRCDHADGTDEEYVLAAIENGVEELGFSDHIMLPDHSQIGIRGEYEVLDNYIESINALKEKYKDKIKIHIGLEAEAMHYYFPYYRHLLESGKIEYLICGNHCEVAGNRLKFFFSSKTTKKDIKKYTSSLIEGMNTGLFIYVAHPDYFMGSYNEWNHFTKRISKKIIKTALKKNIPLEFNFGGVRCRERFFNKEYRLPYPYDKFWILAKKMGAKVILGYDAHSPRDFNYEVNKQGFEMVEKLGLNPIEKLDL